MTTTFTHIIRYMRWGRTLAKHGTLRIFEHHPDAPRAVRFIARLARFGAFAPTVPRYAVAFTALGPAAIKLGQALATRPDLVGAEAAKDLATLQDQLPPFAFADAKALIEAELGAPITTVFEFIDPVAVGAASIAQVHKARTTDGRDVAVKVLRPGIEAQMRSALETYAWGATQLEMLGGEAARLRPRQVIESFRHWVMRELDLRLEAASASELAQYMQGESRYRVPGIDWQRTTKRMLTLDWIDGTKVTDIQALRASGFDMHRLAKTAVEVFLKQAIEYGFFHADMHQGNLFIDTNGKLTVVDFGIMGTLSDDDKNYLARNFAAFFNRDYNAVAVAHIEAGWVPGNTRVDEFESAIRSVCEPIFDKPLNEISFGKVLLRLFEVSRRFQMEIQPQLVLLQKTLLQVEGLGRQLYPELDLRPIAQPILKRWLSEQIGPRGLLKQLRKEGPLWISAVPQLPRLVHRALEANPSEKLAAIERAISRVEQTQRWQTYVLMSLVITLVAVVGAYLYLLLLY